MKPPRIFTLGDPARAATRLDLDEIAAIMTRRNMGQGADYAVAIHFKSAPPAVFGGEEADVRALLDAFDAWHAFVAADDGIGEHARACLAPSEPVTMPIPGDGIPRGPT